MSEIHMNSTQIQRSIGPYQKAYFAYAEDEKMRNHAASGGAVTAVLSHSLSAGHIDGALVCRRVIENSRVRGRMTIARTEKELLEAQGSIYVTVPFNEQAQQIIRDFPGRIGVVGLPCNIQLLRNLGRTNQDIEKKVLFTVALFCGHLSSPTLIDSLTACLERQAGSPLADFYFRRGHWRGHLGASFQDGQIIEKPFSWFSIYQNLYFFCERKCLMCSDHFGYFADLCVGDIWNSSMKANPVKRSSVIVKTDRGSKILFDTVQAGVLSVQEVPIESVYNGQKRVAPTHYNTAAKRAAGRLLGMRLSSHTRGKTGLISFIIASIIILNYRLSRNPLLAKYIMKLPRPLLRIYLYFFKALETIQ
jgi:coenzyme F420-reducing hydrogenase beta subunit